MKTPPEPEALVLVEGNGVRVDFPARRRVNAEWAGPKKSYSDPDFPTAIGSSCGTLKIRKRKFGMMNAVSQYSIPL
jgi:hypothetical protein